MKPAVKKTLKISGIVVGMLVALILLTVLFWLGPTVKLVAENIGSKALGTPLTVDQLTINPRKGLIHLSDFAIKNPATFGQSNAVSLASLDVSIEMGSIFTKTVVVHEVTLNSPHFIYEQTSATDNIQEFILSIYDFIGYDPDAPPDPKELEKERKKREEEAQRKKGKDTKVVVVESLAINDVQFRLANTDDPELDFKVGFDRFSTSMTNGTVRLDDFYISNPGRLETPNLFTLDQLDVQMEPGSIYSSNITIQAVDIRQPHAFVEHNPETDTVWEFLKIADGLVAKIPTNAPQAKATNEVVVAEAEPPAPPPEVVLGTVTIEDMQLNMVDIGDPELDVQLGLEQLAVAMQDGRINMENLFFTNPKRLATPNLFSLDAITVDFEPDSLKADTLVLNDIQVKQPHAFLELNKEADTVGELMKIANGFLEREPEYPIPELPQAPTNDAPTVAETEPEASDEATAPPIELHNLLVDDIQVKLLDSTPTNNVPTEPYTLAGIGSISVKLVDGKIQVKGITMPNAPGFHATNLFHLANIDVDIDPDSLFSDQVVVNRVLVDSPSINLEQTEESGNVAALQTQLMRFVPPPPEGGGEEAIEPATEPTQVENEPVPIAEQPVVLHQLIVTNLYVGLKLPVDTNTTDEARFGVDLKKLNPASMVSLDKLNPMSGNAEEEAEADPNAPLTLVAFNTLSVEPLKGLVSIHDLRVSNPPGFSRRNLVKLEEFRIDLDPDTLQSDVLRIEDIVLTNPRVRYERHIMEDNIKALQEEIEQATVRRGEYMEGQTADTVVEAIEEADGEEVDDEGQKVVIDRVVIDGCIVYAKLSALPAIPVPVPVPDLKDIGKEKGGATPTEASTQIVDTFYEQMINAVGSTTGFAGDTLKGAGSIFGNMAGGLTEGIGNMASGVKEGTKKVTETIKKKKWSRRRAGGRRSPLR